MHQGRIILDSADPLKQARIDIHPHAQEEDLSYLSYALKLMYSKVLPALNEYELSCVPYTGHKRIPVVAVQIKTAMFWHSAQVQLFIHDVSRGRRT